MELIDKHKERIKNEFESYFADFENEISKKEFDDIHELIEKYQYKLTEYVYNYYPSGHGIVIINGIRDTHPLDKLHIVIINYANQLNEKYLEFIKKE